MDKYNGWIEPWRVTRLERVLCTWANMVVGSRYASVRAAADFADTMFLAHLVGVVLDVDVFNTAHMAGTVLPRPLNAQDVLHNARILLELLKARDLKVMCHAMDIEAGDRERIVWLLVQVASYWYASKMAVVFPSLLADPGATPASVKLPALALHGLHNELIPRLDSVPASALPRGLKVPSARTIASGWSEPEPVAAIAFALAPEHIDYVAVVSAGSTPADKFALLFDALAAPPLALPPLLIPSDFDKVEELSLSMFFVELALRARTDPKFRLFSLATAPDTPTSSHPPGTIDYHEHAVQLQMEVESLRDRVQQLQANEAALQVELYDATARSAPLSSKVDEAEATIAQLKADLAAERARLAVVERQKSEVLSRAQDAVLQSTAAREAAEARFKAALESSQALSKKFKRMKLQMELRAKQQEESARANQGVAPPGSAFFSSPDYESLREHLADPANPLDVGPNPVVIMFTDIQGSTSLWEKDAESMANALTVHNNVFRSFLPRMRGYEVKTEGDAFMVAFESPVDAIVCALTLQKELMRCEWPPAILDSPLTAETRDRFGNIIWRGLRVRMALHYGTPELRSDPTTGRMDYFGPMVNRAARVEGVAKGGQVVVSEPFFLHVKELLPTIRGSAPPEATCLGEFELKGIKESMTCYEITDPLLKERVFVDTKSLPKPGTAMNDSSGAVDLISNAATLSSAATEVDTEVSALERENAALIAELENIGADFTVSEKKAVEMASALDAADREYDMLTVEQGRVRLESLIASFRDIDANAAASSSRIAAVTATSKAISNQLTALHSRIHMLQTQAKHFTGASRKSADAASEFMHQIAESDHAALADAKAAYARKAAQVDKLKQRVRQLLRDVAYLKRVNSGTVARRPTDMGASTSELALNVSAAALRRRSSMCSARSRSPSISPALSRRSSGSSTPRGRHSPLHSPLLSPLVSPRGGHLSPGSMSLNPPAPSSSSSSRARPSRSAGPARITPPRPRPTPPRTRTTPPRASRHSSRRSSKRAHGRSRARKPPSRLEPLEASRQFSSQLAPQLASSPFLTSHAVPRRPRPLAAPRRPSPARPPRSASAGSSSSSAAKPRRRRRRRVVHKTKRKRTEGKRKRTEKKHKAKSQRAAASSDGSASLRRHASSTLCTSASGLRSSASRGDSSDSVPSVHITVAAYHSPRARASSSASACSTDDGSVRSPSRRHPPARPHGESGGESGGECGGESDDESGGESGGKSGGESGESGPASFSLSLSYE